MRKGKREGDGERERTFGLLSFLLFVFLVSARRRDYLQQISHDAVRMKCTAQGSDR